MTLDELVAAVDALPDDLTAMARSHCHAMNVDSIVLAKNADGRLSRVFLAWPGHKLHANYPGSPRYTVGVHDHRYDVALRLIRGTAVNHAFERAANGQPHTEYRFTSGVATGKATVERLGDANLCVVESRPLVTFDDVSMTAAVFHTVWVPGNVPTAWLVTEGVASRTTTTLFTNADTIDTDGLYQRFDDPAHVRRRVREFAALAGSVRTAGALS
ncbi:MAG TPA: hypothetical protein VMZ71_10625 [Gemmataceae bacterium]|nr:hypothetical protein [Gemmataceae bacterium]